MTTATRASARDDGYRMPAEWEPHAATWLAWPHDPLTFPGRVPDVEDTYRQMIRALAVGERVNVLVPDEETHDDVRRWVADEGVPNVTIWDVATADVWMRDYGPIFVKRDVPGSNRAEIAATKWRFNAWGNKYESLLYDDAVAHQLFPHLGMPVYENDIVMEGGSIEVNGRGTLMTTRQCLLNENRNPHLSQSDIEKRLAADLDIRHFIWLDEGIEGDDTDGHIDDIARFVGPRTVVTAVDDDVDDVNTAILRKNLEDLRAAKDQDGRPLQVVELPMPGWFGDEEGRLPASYANFYVGNRVVLLPTFGHANDEKAQAILQKVYPTRAIVPIYAGHIIYGMGAFHCVTQQQPMGVASIA